MSAPTRRACLGFAAAFAIPGLARPVLAEDAAIAGRLRARPDPASSTPAALLAGEDNYLGIDRAHIRDAILYVPKSFVPATAMPLLVMLHGAGEDAKTMADRMAPYAEAHGFLLLAPKSKTDTWDLSHAPACEDAVRIDAALARAFALARVDAKHIALGGMSDGASFALSLGLANGDLFHDLLIFSAGLFHIGARVGSPRIFISHGHHDNVLSFSVGKRIADTLSGAGYDVTFRDFDGGHEMPKAIVDEALTRFPS